MDEALVVRWGRGYRAEAAADNYRVAVAGWDMGSVIIEGETDPIQKRRARDQVRDTVEFVVLVLTYYAMDGREGAEELLRLQTYDPARSAGRYLLIFEPGKYRKTQLIVDDLRRQVDLVDLHEAVWFEYLTIHHCDGSEFAPGEHEEVRQAVLDDVRYDFGEDEVGLDFNEFSAGLQVMFS
jgi:hypothetical protein